MKMKPVVDQAIGRSPFCDQGQSMNLFCKDPDFARLYNALMYGWKNGLKTLIYYLRSQPAVNAIKFGLDPLVTKRIMEKRGIKYIENRNSRPASSEPFEGSCAGGACSG